MYDIEALEAEEMRPEFVEVADTIRAGITAEELIDVFERILGRSVGYDQPSVIWNPPFIPPSGSYNALILVRTKLTEIRSNEYFFAIRFVESLLDCLFEPPEDRPSWQVEQYCPSCEQRDDG